MHRARGPVWVSLGEAHSPAITLFISEELTAPALPVPDQRSSTRRVERGEGTRITRRERNSARLVRNVKVTIRWCCAALPLANNGPAGPFLPSLSRCLRDHNWTLSHAMRSTEIGGKGEARRGSSEGNKNRDAPIVIALSGYPRTAASCNIVWCVFFLIYFLYFFIVKWKLLEIIFYSFYIEEKKLIKSTK